MFLKKASVFSLLFLISCSSSQKRVSKSQMSVLQVQKLELAFKLVEKKQFIKAGKLYDSLSLSLKDSSAEILSLYNAGLAYKSARDCEKALLRFRAVLDRSFKDFKDFQARALLEISFVYECLGQSDLSVSSLKDLEKNLKFLPFYVQKIIYPARLSLAWARLGELHLAEAYKSLSLNQILEYKKNSQPEVEVKREISRLFYLMGKSYVKKKYLKAENFIPSFVYHQVFLLQSLFLKDETWSPQAREELNRLFDRLIFALSQTENKQLYKKRIEGSLKIGSSLVKQEKSKEWESFYDKKSKLVVKLFN